MAQRADAGLLQHQKVTQQCRFESCSPDQLEGYVRTVPYRSESIMAVVAAVGIKLQGDPLLDWGALLLAFVAGGLAVVAALKSMER